MIPPQPNVCLFCNRQVEEPALTIDTQKFWERSRVTVFLTECMALLMLQLEVKNVDQKTDILEERISLDMLRKTAVVVKDYVIRFEDFNTEDVPEKLLKCSGE